VSQFSFFLAITLLSFSSYLFLSLLGHFTAPHLDLIQGHRWQKDLFGIRSEDNKFFATIDVLELTGTETEGCRC